MLRTAFRLIIDTLLPPHDVVLRAREVQSETLGELLSPRTVGSYVWVHALWPYSDERVRCIIKSIKYYGDKRMSNRVGVLAADYVIELASELQQFRGWENSIIVPVASSAARSRERGYNQAARIARAIARTAELPYAEILTRDDRQSQVHVPRAKRKSNIAGAFRAGVAASGRHIILIDDVVESGATLVDARRALLEAGAAGVVAIAIAH